MSAGALHFRLEVTDTQTEQTDADWVTITIAPEVADDVMLSARTLAVSAGEQASYTVVCARPRPRRQRDRDAGE